MPRILAALSVMLSLAAWASAEGRAFAEAFPYENAVEPREGVGLDNDAWDDESMVGSSVRGVIDDDLGLPDGNVY